MLTSDLVQAVSRRGEVHPRYVDESDPEILALAERVVEVFGSHVGRRRRELDAELVELLGSGTEFLLHRGFAKLMLDRCEFDCDAPREPAELRRAVFEASAAAWRENRPAEEGVGTRFDRDACLAGAAAALELDVAIIERNLHGDLKSEQVLREWKACTPAWLLSRYNVALAQAVLLRAVELQVVIGPQPPLKRRALFQKIKFFQLLYRVEPRRRGEQLIRLDGPLSLFRASQKYGLQMATFLPTLLHLDDWQLDARVLWGKAKREQRFRLAAGDGLRPIGHLTGQWQPDEYAWLPGQLAELDAGWEAAVGEEVLDLGGQGVLVPDWVFRHADGLEVHMEVMGYWRKGGVAARLELLRSQGPPNFILALSKELVADEDDLADLPVEVYVFRSHPLARKVLARLERIRKKSRD